MPTSDFALGGLVAAPYTPFTPSGDLHLAVVEKQAEKLLATGVKGAFICGTTGEGLSLTTAERMQLAERWVQASKGSLKVVVHVAHLSQRDAIELARHAQGIKASAIAALPPFFFKPGNAEQIVEFMAPVAAAAPALPFYYYHIPSMTGVAVPMLDVLATGASRIPTLRGIKFTHSDLMDYQRCHRFMDGRFEIAWGFDEMLLGALAVGAQSAVGSTYNYAAPLYERMIAAFRASDLDTARQCSQRAAELVALLLKHGILRTGKAILALTGVDCGPPRAPLVPLSPSERTAVEQSLYSIGFFDWSR